MAKKGQELAAQHILFYSAAPQSYRSNNKKETVLLSYADNFQRQFRQLYGDRKKLFIRPANEHGIEVTSWCTVPPAAAINVLSMHYRSSCVPHYDQLIYSTSSYTRLKVVLGLLLGTSTMSYSTHQLNW